MKKIYNAPALELLDFLSNVAIGGEWAGGPDPEDALDSKPWNEGELGWT